MHGVSHAAKTEWRTRWASLAARRADLDPARGSHTELGGSRTGARGLAELYRRASRESFGEWHRAERRRIASSHAHLSHGARGRACHYRVSKVAAGRSSLGETSDIFATLGFLAATVGGQFLLFRWLCRAGPGAIAFLACPAAC